jgi:hypothetical protein
MISQIFSLNIISSSNNKKTINFITKYPYHYEYFLTIILFNRNLTIISTMYFFFKNYPLNSNQSPNDNIYKNNPHHSM